jgi:hypothetical protein
MDRHKGLIIAKYRDYGSAKQIEKMTERMGFRVAAATILKYLWAWGVEVKPQGGDNRSKKNIRGINNANNN